MVGMGAGVKSKKLLLKTEDGDCEFANQEREMAGANC